MAVGITHVIHHANRPVRRISKAWESVRREAGAEHKDSPHVMRHTSATLFMNSGQDVAVISGFLGMSVEVLMSTYAHHHPQFQEGIAQVSPRKQTNRTRTK
jgi:site-specific recombinase XerD